MHICVIVSDNGSSPGQCQVIIWTNVAILLIGPLGTNFSEISIEIITFPVKKMHLKTSSGNWQRFRLGLNVLICFSFAADGSSGFPAEANRYHLYVSLGCPFASRTLVARKLKGLDEAISVTVVNPVKGSDTWSFTDQVSWYGKWQREWYPGFGFMKMKLLG